MPTGEAKRITFENRDIRHPVWAADGREIIFSGGEALWRIAPGSTGQAAKPQRLASFGDNVSQPAISRRGSVSLTRMGSFMATFGALPHQSSM